MKHRQIASGELVVAGGNASELLQTVNETLHPIAFAVNLPIERAGAGLVGSTRDGVANTATTQEAAHGRKTVPLVADDPLGPFPWPSATRSLDRALAEQLLKDGDLMTLATCQHECDRLALAVGPEMEFGTQAAPRAT